jgi:transposase InsO family protein
MGNTWSLALEGWAMPWGALSAMDLRLEFCELASREGANVRLLCRRYEIAPKTGYKWLARWRETGFAGVAERSRRPSSSPWRTDAEIEAAVLALRAEHPAWGGRKISAVLAREGRAAPAPSTITAILRRHGCEIGAFGGGAAPFRRFEHDAPNDLWQMDFKGHVAMADGRRLHPLTVLDDHSRYCLALAACADQKTATVQGFLTDAFRRYGLPRTLITDNGSPWGDGPGSPYTPLGVFLIDQGVRVSHARPYHPQTMGKDERFHRSLKAEALGGGPFADLSEAARRLAAWREIYNRKRPHEGIGMAVPAARYAASPREYREKIAPFDPAPGDVMRRVQDGGLVSFKGRQKRLPKAFRGRDIALRASETDGVFDVYYRHQNIARLDFRTQAGDARPVTHVSERVLPMSPVCTPLKGEGDKTRAFNTAHSPPHGPNPAARTADGPARRR